MDTVVHQKSARSYLSDHFSSICGLIIGIVHFGQRELGRIGSISKASTNKVRNAMRAMEMRMLAGHLVEVTVFALMPKYTISSLASVMAKNFPIPQVANGPTRQ